MTCNVLPQRWFSDTGIRHWKTISKSVNFVFGWNWSAVWKSPFDCPLAVNTHLADVLFLPFWWKYTVTYIKYIVICSLPYSWYLWTFFCSVYFYFITIVIHNYCLFSSLLVFFITLMICCLHYVCTSALEAPNTKTNSLCVQSLLQALSDSDVIPLLKHGLGLRHPGNG